jgi:monovalent cation:H+ antiporter, CPA1 family
MTGLEILSVLFATAAVFGLISSRWLKMPITVGTMLLTALVSALLTLGATVAPGIHHWASDLVRQIDFQNIVMHGLLPLLLFAGAFLLDLQQLAREKLSVSLFATAGTVLTFVLVAALMWLLSAGHLPWMQCLLFGTLISPTDPIAVLEMLRRAGVPKKIQAQLAGESLFNDGLGAVLFITMLEVAGGDSPTPWHIAGLLVVEAGGGILVGLLAAWLTARMMRLCNAFLVDILFTLALALGGYALADLMHMSAPLEAVVAGITLRYLNRNIPRERVAHENLDHFWSVIDEVQNSILFVLLGLEVMAIKFDAPTIGLGLAAILSVNVVRLTVVVLLLSLVHYLRPSHRSSKFVLTWGGLRGGLSIALALSVPEELGRSWMLGATYLAVFFSIVIQGGSMEKILRRLRDKKLEPEPSTS